MRRVIKDAMKDYGKEITDLLEQPTRSWMPEHRPDFMVSEPRQDGNDLVAVAGVDPKGSGWQASVPFAHGENDPPGSVIYRWVSRGTKRHPIVPIEAPWLHYWHKYIPSTSPGDWRSRKAGNTGSLEVYSDFADHPGIEPRRFEERAAEEKGPGFAAAIQNAISGHVGAGNLLGPVPKQGGRVALGAIGAASRKPNRRRR
jgi:hypothetical protein